MIVELKLLSVVPIVPWFMDWLAIPVSVADNCSGQVQLANDIVMSA
jgi:hypothetical protein